MKNNNYKIYFRIRPFRYFIAREKELKYWCIVKKKFDPDKLYYWDEI